MKRVAVILVAGILVGCQTSPQTQELVSRNQQLEQDLNRARSEIDSLTVEKQSLQADIDELNRLVTALDTEKDSRAEQAIELRRQVRGFVQGQIDSLKQFLVVGDLLDYIGDELIDRQQVEDEPLLLVDLDNPVPRNGTLTGVGAQLSKAAPFSVMVLRPIQDELVVIWESALVSPESSGFLRQEFPVSVGLEKGDYLAYRFPEITGVGFSEGTGDTRYTNRDIQLGDSIRRASLDGEDEKRSYSIGVYGLLNLE